MAKSNTTVDLSIIVALLNVLKPSITDSQYNEAMEILIPNAENN